MEGGETEVGVEFERRIKVKKEEKVNLMSFLNSSKSNYQKIQFED